MKINKIVVSDEGFDYHNRKMNFISLGEIL